MYHRELYHLSPWNPENWIFEPGRRLLVWTDICCLLWVRLSFKTAKSYRSLPTFEDDCFFHSFGMYRFCTRIQWNLPDRWSKPNGENSLLSEKWGAVKLLNSKIKLGCNQGADFCSTICFSFVQLASRITITTRKLHWASLFCHLYCWDVCAKSEFRKGGSCPEFHEMFWHIH